MTQLLIRIKRRYVITDILRQQVQIIISSIAGLLPDISIGAIVQAHVCDQFESVR